jgi:predicted methyltransferase
MEILMKPSSRNRLALAVAVGLLASCATTSMSPDMSPNAAPTSAPGLAAVVAGEHRSAANRARDGYRHPAETLGFFGIRSNMTVVELWPFGGWYAEILAPYLRDQGVYYAAAMDPQTASAQELSYNEALTKLLTSRPDLYSKVRVTALSKSAMDVAPAGSADLVLSFRNIHNWTWSGIDKDVFAAAYKALKPGGVLGIVEHRHNDPNFEPRQPGQAYVGEEYAVRLIESVGFKLVGRSDINNNPKDSKDHPRGVWTLPPIYALGDQDRAKYAAIGESDRFTLKFVK